MNQYIASIQIKINSGSFLMNNVNDYHRYKLKIKYTIKDLSTALLSDFDK